MKNNINYEYGLHTEFKSKAEILACILEEKRKEQHKIVYVKGRLVTVYLSEKQLQHSTHKATKQGIELTQYYTQKYSA